MLDIVKQNRYNYSVKERGDIMSTTPTQVRIDTDIKQQVTALFENLGLDMSSAVNMFLHQCVLRGGLPFTVEMPQYSTKTLEAMAEAKRISSDSSVKGYTDMEQLKAALEE